MVERHPIFIVKNINTINFCNRSKGYEFLGSMYKVPFEIEPTLGEHDFNTCETCQQNLSTVTNILTDIYSGKGKVKPFPNCCDQHQKLLTFQYFNKEHFDNVPSMVAKKLVYTLQYILNNIDSDDWYLKIVQYIEYVIGSFGQMPEGYGSSLYLGDYCNWVVTNMNDSAKFPPEKRTKIIEYFNSLGKKSESIDIKSLMETYNKWLKLFPFELNSYFGNLKEYFEKNIHILIEKPIINPFTNLASSKLHTRKSLFEALVRLTDKLLIQINGTTLLEQGLITDANKMSLELVINNRKLELTQGYNSDSPNEEIRYIRMIKKWFEHEKRFMKELIPIISESTIKVSKSKSDLLKENLHKNGFYKIEKVSLLSNVGQEKLLNLLVNNDMPFCIAMFDYLEYFEYLKKELFKTNVKLNIEVSKWFNSNKDGRAVKGNRSTLSSYSKEDKKKYTAHLHKENVIKEYQKIK